MVEELLARDLDVRTAHTAPDAVRTRFVHRTEAVHFDFRDDATFGPALEGVSRVFLIRPCDLSRRPHPQPVCRLCLSGRVEAIVFSSVAGAETNPIVPHHRVETHLWGSGIAWTMLRPGFFTQNIKTAYRRDIIEDDRIYVPAGDGHVVSSMHETSPQWRLWPSPTHHTGERHITSRDPKQSPSNASLRSSAVHSDAGSPMSRPPSPGTSLT